MKIQDEFLWALLVNIGTFLGLFAIVFNIGHCFLTPFMEVDILSLSQLVEFRMPLVILYI